MFRVKTLAAALCFLLLSVAAVQAAELKIAVFNLSEVAEKSNVLKEASAGMDKVYTPKRNEIEKERVALEQKSAAMKNPTPAQIAELEKAQRDYSAKASNYLKNIQAAEAEVTSQVEGTITQAAREYAKKNGYNLILDSHNAPYADSALDITSDMIGEVNRVWREAKK